MRIDLEKITNKQETSIEIKTTTTENLAITTTTSSLLNSK